MIDSNLTSPTFLSILSSPFLLIKNIILIGIRRVLTLIDEPHEKILANFIIIGIFAVIYYFIYKIQAKFNKKDVLYTPYSTKSLSMFDALYFSFVVHFTLGFGDVFPVSIFARIAVMLHTTIFWFINFVSLDLIDIVSTKLN